MSSNPNAIAELTASELLRRYRDGTLSPVEATEAALARIRAHNETVNAFCLVDEETTLAAARRAEQRYHNTSPMGELDGVPVAIKDVFLTRGWPNLKGSKTVDPAGPWEQDAPAVSALRRHGFVPLGKTTTPELGWKGVTDCPCYGVTRNPFDPDKTAGGSSGGSASSVVLGMGPLALGTDAGGSIRIPAGFSGLVGHKPTQGRVPLWPASPFGQLAHPGPMTWTVEDAARLMNVIAEPDPRDPTLPAAGGDYVAALAGGVGGLRVAFSPNLGYVQVDPEIARSVAEAARLFEGLGAQVEEVDPGFADPREAFDLLFFGGAANALRSIPEERHAEMDPNLIEAVGSVRDASMLDYLAAMNERAALIERTSLFHQRYDLLLTPTLPIPAFTAGLEVPEGWHDRRWPSWTPFTYPFNMTGQPACSVPCGFTAQGLPIGLQIVGTRHADALVLRAAHTYQQAAPLTDQRPAWAH
ncbi:amidase [Halorhodospira halophila]|uniref:amidase n=1 Tax=Halorhodospira halophila TaxID=1053 RepID=UPI00191139A6|nr:amidase [Halorhodospira halophila]MBK5944287.1 amidase [Halorhodospira halophila]